MSIRLAEANRAIQAALAKAQNLAVNISVIVCDADGRPVAFQRMDGTLAEAHRGSYGKALVSATSGRPSGDESIEFSDGELPAKVPDAVIAEIRSRERNGLVELVKPGRFRPGMRVRVTSGPLSERIGMLAVLRPHERVIVLLNLLGGDQRVDLAMNAIEAV